MVSKAMLDRTEARLRALSEELRREIADRTRVQTENTHLRIALKRTERLSAMGSLVAGVAHEVRNPLFGMSSTLDALHARMKRAGADGAYQDHLRVLRVELERLRKLMQDLLDYGKPAATELADASVAELIACTVQACQGGATERQVAIAVRVEPEDLAWPLDRGRMEQAIRNLLENAIQYSPRGGTVHVLAELAVREGDTGPWLRMVVYDEGSGFDPLQLSNVFTPFFTRRRGGTGLGLSIVERVAEAHGGLVWAANRPGGGAELTIELPRAAPETTRREGPGAA